MRRLGVVLMLFGIFNGLCALAIDPSLGEVHNLARAQWQMLAFMSACTFILTGAVFVAAGTLDETLFKIGRMLRKHHKEIVGTEDQTPSVDEDSISS